jgi:hypothetical protein
LHAKIKGLGNMCDIHSTSAAGPRYFNAVFREPNMDTRSVSAAYELLENVTAER